MLRICVVSTINHAAFMAYNVSGVAEPAQRVAERPAGEERFNTPQTRDESGGISASAEHRSEP